MTTPKAAAPAPSGAVSAVRKAALTLAAIDIAFGGAYALMIFFGPLLRNDLWLKIPQLGYFRVTLALLQGTVDASFQQYLTPGVVQSVIALADPTDRPVIEDALTRMPVTFSTLNPGHDLCSASDNSLSNVLRSTNSKKLCDEMAPEIQWASYSLLGGVGAYAALTFVGVQFLLWYAAMPQRSPGDKAAPGARLRTWFYVLHTLGCVVLSFAAMAYLFETSAVASQLQEWSVLGKVASVKNMGLFRSVEPCAVLFVLFPLIQVVVVGKMAKDKKFRRADEYDKGFSNLLAQTNLNGSAGPSYGSIA